MSARLAVRGVGAVGGFGCGKAALIGALTRGGRPNSEIRVATPSGEVTFPAYLADVSPVTEVLPKRKLRRADKFSRMTALGAALALRDAGLTEVDPSRVGIAVGTGYGGIESTFRFIDSAIEFGDAGASPTIFSYSGNSGALSTATIALGITGPSLTVSQFEVSVPAALMSARQWLLDGRIDVLLVGGVDETCDVLGYCRERFFGAANRGPIRPLDFNVQTAVVGEGCAFLALTRDAEAPARYGYLEDVVMGHGTPNIPKNAWVFLGADGHRTCGRQYRKIAAGHPQTAAFSPVYGSMPAGAAFDWAVAALALEQGTVPDLPECLQGLPHGAGNLRDPVASQICCLKCDGQGYFGMVRLSRS